MENILELADKLGQAIASHERYQAVRKAEEKASTDPAATRAQNELEAQLIRISQLEREGKPIEVSDKRELQRLQDNVRSLPLLQELAKAQADYFEMMNGVNDAIINRLRPVDEDSD